VLLPGEVVWRVPSLALPDGATDPEAYESVRLLLARAAAAVPGFELTDRNAADIVTLCRRLDGLPLAPGAGRGPPGSLPVSELVARLDDRFALLVGGSRVGLTRQQTLRATVDWSYDLLTEPERILLRAWPCSRADSRWPLPRRSARTIGSTGRRRRAAGRAGRPIAGRAGRRRRPVPAAGDHPRVRGRAAARGDRAGARPARPVGAPLAEQAEPELAHTGRAHAFRRLAVEDGNLRAALTWLHANDPPRRWPGRAVVALLAAVRGLVEGLQVLRVALNVAPDPTPDRARALLGVCGLTTERAHDCLECPGR